MGYITTFTLEINAPQEVIEEIVQFVAGKIEFKYMRYALGNCLENDGDACKWYEYVDDMKLLSKQFPDALFILHGRGEESPDIWYHYFKGGKSQLAKGVVTFDEYDENKLV